MNEKYVPNTLRQRLHKGEQLIGCWSSLGSPITTEVLGLAGFDWILLDGEHAPNDVLSFVPQLMALKDSSSMPIVRPPKNDPVIIKRLLDIGFYNILVPYVETEEDALQAVASTRYPPVGIRGVSVSHRNNGYATIPDYFKVINDNIGVIVQVESRLGVENVEKIAVVDGVDCLFVGPGDLSAALGYLGQPNHPEVQKVIQHIFATAKKYGKACGILAPAEEDARRYISWGATFVSVGSDLGVFRSGSQALCNKFISK
ncbi:2-dehydro-3-deoxyglucarate aldolase [Neisseria perflava]|uniref:2-dehydro-3-deoxyglucarate aldolase n=1 Tax=Neisseria perflava TaxID=33053 RepID=UPI00209F0A64|nr:2-dehydro-3-deoxyglucarate aldolase [Neisseria perflava]MCP1661297.1 2-dehydro-3-deoxyglucarate aldolase [Neisseria perflava]MCP1773109.1 2-dehydro-3-deoxyglucarate aldolase [Neisseria perflava]